MNHDEKPEEVNPKMPRPRGTLSEDGAQGFIDISMPIRKGMLNFPGNPQFSIERVDDLKKGAPANVSVLRMSSHAGTHVDAPKHFLEDGEGVERLLLSKLVGPAKLIAVEGSEVRVEDLRRAKVGKGDRVLFQTRNSRERLLEKSEFHEDFVTISDEAGKYLAETEVVLVGVDYLSVESPEEEKNEAFRVHHALLSRKIVIVEGLQLADVPPGDYELICLPLRIVGADGAPARAILRPLAHGS